MPSRAASETSTLRLAELLGGLAIGADLGSGMPMESSLGAAILAVRLGRKLGLSELEDLFLASLLRFVGCTVGSSEAARLGGGDDHALNRALALADLTDAKTTEVVLARNAAPHLSATRRKTLARKAVANIETIAGVAFAHCEQASRLAQALSLRAPVVMALEQMYERWDGKGGPLGLAGESISLPARVLSLTTTAELLRRVAGTATAIDLLASRRGKELDPTLVDCFTRDAPALLRGLDAPSLWEVFLDADPAATRVPSTRLLQVAGAFAEMVDQKSGFTAGHSQGVAAAARLAAESCGVHGSELEQIQIAALLHDVGRLAVPTGLWDKPGSFTPIERRRAQSHSVTTETVLAQVPCLLPFADVAAAAHERADGSGYHRRLVSQTRAATIVSAADVFVALSEHRPHRAAYARQAAVALLLEEARSGHLARDAVHAVLEGAGERTRTRAAVFPAGLSKREVDVLRLIVAGLSNKEIAVRLELSPKTIEHHISHVYEKTGLRARPRLAIFAVENGLAIG